MLFNVRIAADVTGSDAMKGIQQAQMMLCLQLAVAVQVFSHGVQMMKVLRKLALY
jgi:hypothetical protein